MSRPEGIVAPAVAAVIAAQALAVLGDQVDSEQADEIGRAAVKALRADGWCVTVDHARSLTRVGPQLWDYDPTILAGLARGHTAMEIAETTGVPFGTVRNRMMRLRRRLGAANSAHVVAIAYRSGWMAGLPPEPRPPVQLSSRQRAVLGHMADGLDNAQIAEELGISKDTAVTYVRRLYNNLAATRPGDAAPSSRAHAVALAFQHGHLPLAPTEQLAAAS